MARPAHRRKKLQHRIIQAQLAFGHRQGAGFSEPAEARTLGGLLRPQSGAQLRRLNLRRPLIAICLSLFVDEMRFES
jgi:hypothetical protein